MGVYELSGAGSVKTGRTLYTSMNAGNQYGAMVPIATSTLSSNGYFEFSNIPQNYQDLFVSVNARAAATVGDSGFSNQSYITAYFNDITSNYSVTFLIADGTSATSTRASSQSNCYFGFIPNQNATSGIFGATTIQILNYANTSTFKTTLSRTAGDANGSGTTTLTVNSWRNTLAINKITLYCSYTNFLAGTTATLYGIRAVSS
jgi:hypothetical protein